MDKLKKTLFVISKFNRNLTTWTNSKQYHKHSYNVHVSDLMTYKVQVTRSFGYFVFLFSGSAPTDFLYPQLGEQGSELRSLHECTDCLLHSPHYEFMVDMPSREIPLRLLCSQKIRGGCRRISIQPVLQILHIVECVYRDFTD